MLKNFLSIFKSSTGNYDMGRIISCKISFVFSGGFGYAILGNHQVINWTEAGAGFLAVMTGIAALIGGKEIAIAKAGAITNAAQQ